MPQQFNNRWIILKLIINLRFNTIINLSYKAWKQNSITSQWNNCFDFIEILKRSQYFFSSCNSTFKILFYVGNTRASKVYDLFRWNNSYNNLSNGRQILYSKKRECCQGSHRHCKKYSLCYCALLSILKFIRGYFKFNKTWSIIEYETRVS